ncbi:hypothetical protein [Paenibacillus xylanivorans]|uniref:Uncharacterized protein n=1 Tax=Paenibacillus xylanivorans TaxID=1705561 RepID=A0A0M9BIW4_9BACL|nr:hypothetical protein [Paenibacillus xylanivorans]KOY12869.1 hypothetical protein AMS66_31290 [Paenibacillus xylanivorans]
MANFKYVETITTSQDLLTKLKEEVTGFKSFPFESTAGESQEQNLWEVFYEEKDNNDRVQELILRGVMTIGTQATPITKNFYVSFINHALVPRVVAPVPAYEEHSTLTVQLLEGLEGSEPTTLPVTTRPTFKLTGHPVLYQWALENYTPTDRNKEKPVYMYVNVMNNRLAMVLVADPAVNFLDYKKSFLYAGALKPFKYNLNDVDGNVMLTAGAVIEEPDISQIAKTGTYYYGQYTSAGNNTLQMLKTKSGIEFQQHYPSFITQAPPKGKAYLDPELGDTGLELEPQGFQASKWTSKYHLSPIYVVHPYEGYRGQFDNCIAVTKHNILHLDELIIDVEGKSWDQEVYRYFDTDTAQNFMNLSANQRMGVAILKEVRYTA